MKGYDIIGDIHGQYAKLTDLLAALGYKAPGGEWRHPEGRQVIFLGDYIDRGPEIRRVLHLVRRMCDEGNALAIMGNHEYNAVCYHTPDGNGSHLRPRRTQNRLQHAATLAEFFDSQDEWMDWVAWMKRLPFYLDLGALRVVHAAWHPEAMAAIGGASLTDDAFLHASAMKGSPEYRALEALLKGVEVALPKGVVYMDKDGHERRAIRSRWWSNERAGVTYRSLVFPPALSPPDVEVPREHLESLPGYGAGEPPVFVGHYWLPADAAAVPQCDNLACLDYSAAKDGPLTAYRWDGEQVLSADRFLRAEQSP